MTDFMQDSNLIYELYSLKKESVNKMLNKEEIKLFRKLKDEYYLNRSINNLSHLLLKHKLYIPYLSADDGNCLFDSLDMVLFNTNVKCGDNYVSKIIATYLLEIFRDVDLNILDLKPKTIEDFITLNNPNSDDTVSKVFQTTNEVSHAKVKRKNVSVDYNFICAELFKQKAENWDVMPVELILRLITLALNITIEIYHDNGHITRVGKSENNIVRLGLIEEYHYLPIFQFSNVSFIKHDEKCKYDALAKQCQEIIIRKKICL